MKIYIAGPYSADNIIDVLANIKQGIEAGHKLISMGYAVFCPFLDYQFAFFNSPGNTLTKEQYQANSMEWVKVCDAILLLPGWEKSGGVKRELEVAGDIPVFNSVEEIVRYL